MRLFSFKRLKKLNSRRSSSSATLSSISSETQNATSPPQPLSSRRQQQNQQLRHSLLSIVSKLISRRPTFKPKASIMANALPLDDRTSSLNALPSQLDQESSKSNNCNKLDHSHHSATTNDVFSSSSLPLVRADAYVPSSESSTSSSIRPNAEGSQLSPDIEKINSVSANEQDAQTLPSTPEYFVYIWGDNSWGQTLTRGSGPGPFRVERLAKQCVCHVNCGTDSTWIVSEAGDLWAGGRNTKGQISPAAAEDEPDVRHAMRVEEFEAMRVKCVGVGEDHTVVVLCSGVAFSYGCNEFGQLGHGVGTETLLKVNPRPVLGLCVPVSQVVCGFAHTLLLSTTGQVFTCGNGADGCLGQGDDTTLSSPLFRPVPALFGVPIQQICSGPEHSIALSLSGKMFGWGRNKKGCLGLGDSNEVSNIVTTPRCVEGLPALKYLSAGYEHTAAIASRGRLYMCGDNSEGQLGVDPALVFIRPTFVQLENIPKIRLAACGDKHTALISHSGEIMTFGRNAEGQLGYELNNVPTWKPTKVPFQTSDLFFYALAAGRDHTTAVAVRLPSGLTRQMSQVVMSQGSLPSLNTLDRWLSTDNPAAVAIQSSLRRLGSNIAVLRQPSEARLNPLSLTESYSKLSSASATPIPVSPNTVMLEKSVPRAARDRPNLSLFQSLLSTSSTGPVDANMTINRLSHGKHPPTQADEHLFLPAGCSVGEILGFLESLRGAKDPQEQLRLLLRRLGTVFSDIHRMNCSFLLPTRLAILDSEGLEEIHKLIETLDASFRHAIEAKLYNSMWECLEQAEPYAKYYTETDQIRFLSIILQTGFLETPTAAAIRLLSKLVKIIFDVPEAGRRALRNMFRQQYAANVFKRRLLHNTKQFLNTVIAAQGNHYQTVPSIWHGVILMHLLRSASIEWAADDRTRSLELKADQDSKLPLEEFILESISVAVDPSYEQQLYRQYTKTTTHTKEIRQLIPPRSPFAFSATRLVSNEPAVATTIPLANNNTQENVSTASEPISENPQSSSETSSPRVIVVIPPVLTAEEALTTHEIKESWTFFLAHMWLCPLRFKRNVIIVEALACQRQIGMRSLLVQSTPFFFLPVRRTHLVEDALNIILCSPAESLLKPLKIRFDGEEGVDEGGLKREFFSLLVETLFHPNYGMFTYNSESRTVWFNRNTIDTRREFFLVGVVLGLALYNDIRLSLKFPLAVFKKLQDESYGIEDLADVFPQEGHSFQKILDWPADQTEEFNQYFGDMNFDLQYDYFGELRTVELLPGGSEKLLTYDSRKNYVNLYVKYLLETSIETQFQAFHEGFSRFQTILVKSLSGKELQLLICGSSTLDFYDLKKGAHYEGYKEDDTYIQDFWDILFSLNEHQKKQFLQFCTGTDRVPLGGLCELALKIQKNGTEPTDRLPTAYTCFNTLLLPTYSHKEKLERLLVIAIEQSQGFGLQ